MSVLQKGMGGGVLWLLLLASGIGALIMFVLAMFKRNDDADFD